MRTCPVLALRFDRVLREKEVIPGIRRDQTDHNRGADYCFLRHVLPHAVSVDDGCLVRLCDVLVVYERDGLIKKEVYSIDTNKEMSHIDVEAIPMEAVTESYVDPMDYVYLLVVFVCIVNLAKNLRS